MYLLRRKMIDIYANISLFISYSEVTDPVLIQPRWSLQSPDPVRIQIRWSRSAPRGNLYSSYSPERQRDLGHVNEPQREIPSEDPVT